MNTLSINHSFTSPNFDARQPGTAIEYLILHYTACDFNLSLHMLTDSNSTNPVSAHYLIDEVGKVFQLVPDAQRAWHAGISAWQGKQGLNTWSLGIELVYPGQGDYPPAQLESCLHLCQSLVHKHAIPAANVIGHSDIAPERKTDPGEAFPWKAFAERGVGLHPEQVTLAHLETAAKYIQDISFAQRRLQDIGYGVDCDGLMNAQTQAVIRAFQRHFDPENLGSEYDVGCLAKICAVAEAMRGGGYGD